MADSDIAEEIVRAVVARLKAARESKQLSLRGLERLCGITNGGISHIENGTRSPSLYTLIRISRALDLRAGELLLEAEEELSDSTAGSDPSFS